MAPTATDVRTLTVREIALDDAVAVAELSGQLGYKTSSSEMTQRIHTILPLRSHVALVACLAGSVVGWIEAEVVHHLQSAPYALITGLVVKDGVRSSGVGKRLCNEVEQWSRQHGLSLLRVTSRSTREGAHRFYLREGFVQTKTSLVFEKVLS